MGANDFEVEYEVNVYVNGDLFVRIYERCDMSRTCENAFFVVFVLQ